MKNGIYRIIHVFFYLLLANVIMAQVAIGDVNLAIPINNADCSSLNAGETIQFSRTGFCAGNILITLDGVEVLNTSEISPSYTFASVGQYIVFCGAAPNAVATPKVCYSVSAAQSIPTLSEWGLICLALLFLIVVSLSHESRGVLDLS